MRFIHASRLPVRGQEGNLIGCSERVPSAAARRRRAQQRMARIFILVAFRGTFAHTGAMYESRSRTLDRMLWLSAILQSGGVTPQPGRSEAGKPQPRQNPAQPAGDTGRPDAPKTESPRRVPVPRVLSQPTSVPRPVPPRTPRSLAQQRVDWAALEKAARTALRVGHYAMKTEKAYLHWIRQFVGFHYGRRPFEMGGPEIHAFLSHLAIDRHVAASTQNQALNAVVFLYRKVIKKELEDFSDFERARLPKRLPVG
jgi:hypothetical protein